MSGKKIKNSMAPAHWKTSCVHSECTLNQIAPYIGKIKSSIAKDLILRFSKEKDLVIDPFVGSGTISLEAILNNRNSFAVDCSPYSKILCLAKFNPPDSLDSALEKVESFIAKSSSLDDPDLRKVPIWVRRFFNPQTLKETIKFSQLCKDKKEYFLLAALLGILHHQRPGFLSYPASHLVPYLRDKKFPINQYPEMYEYRELRPRIIAKIKRIYKRFNKTNYNIGNAVFKLGSIEKIDLPESFDCVITSPPYMNALDYNRDNRLRLWFSDSDFLANNPTEPTAKRDGFTKPLIATCKKINNSLKIHGYCIFIVGEKILRNQKILLSDYVTDLLNNYAPNLKLQHIIRDDIPDVRRSRKNYKGTKAEHIMVYRKIADA